jgi:hypothetical protein
MNAPLKATHCGNHRRNNAERNHRLYPRWEHIVLILISKPHAKQRLFEKSSLPINLKLPEVFATRCPQFQTNKKQRQSNLEKVQILSFYPGSAIRVEQRAVRPLHPPSTLSFPLLS